MSIEIVQLVKEEVDLIKSKYEGESVEREMQLSMLIRKINFVQKLGLLEESKINEAKKKVFDVLERDLVTEGNKPSV